MDPKPRCRRRHRRRAPSRHVQAGYSLYDLMVTSAIAGFLGVGAVGMNGLIQDARMTAAVNQLVGDLMLARSEAIKRNMVVTLCKSGDASSCSSDAAWNRGWIVFADENNNHKIDVDETIIRVRQELTAGMTLRYGEAGTYSYLRYSPASEVYPTATFTLCDQRGAGKAKGVVVNWTGRVRVATKAPGSKPLTCS